MLNKNQYGHTSSRRQIDNFAIDTSITLGHLRLVAQAALPLAPRAINMILASNDYRSMYDKTPTIEDGRINSLNRWSIGIQAIIKDTTKRSSDVMPTNKRYASQLLNCSIPVRYHFTCSTFVSLTFV